MSITRKLAVAGTTGALTLGLFAAGPAVAQGDGAPPEDGRHGPDARQDRRVERRAAMAEQLGIGVDTLEDAARAAHDAVVAEYGEPDPSSDDREARRDAFSEALASELGISVDDLHAARDAVFTLRVNDLVASGRITEEQAAEMTAAYENGTLRDYVRAQRQQHMIDRLAQAVEDGRLTQEQADEIRERIENGERPDGPIRPGGPDRPDRPERPGGPDRPERPGPEA